MSTAIRTAKIITDLSIRTLAAGQAHIDNHASGQIARLADDQIPAAWCTPPRPTWYSGPASAGLSCSTTARRTPGGTCARTA